MSTETPPARSGFFSRLRDGLRKTRESLIEKIETVLTGATIDEAMKELMHIIESAVGPLPDFAILYNRGSVPATDKEFRLLMLTDALLHAAYQAGRVDQALNHTMPDRHSGE